MCIRDRTAEQQFVKRLVDIVFSLLGLIVASPFMLVIAILVKAYDGGPVFYRQPRLTKDGKVFDVLKFRSMRVDSEKKGARLAMKNEDVYKRQAEDNCSWWHLPDSRASCC